MTDPERKVLQFAAAHHAVTAEQTAELPTIGEDDSASILDRLVFNGQLVRRALVSGEVSIHAITPVGLAEIRSDLPAPQLDPTGLRHGLAAGWVWLRARDGRFTGAEVLSEREQVARDSRVMDETTELGRRRSCGVRVPGFASAHATGLHYPDVLLMDAEARIAVDVQLVMPSSMWLAALLRAYGADERYRSLVFLVEQERVAQAVEAAAVSVGVANVTAVHWMEWP